MLQRKVKKHVDANKAFMRGEMFLFTPCKKPEVPKHEMFAIYHIEEDKYQLRYCKYMEPHIIYANGRKMQEGNNSPTF